MPPNTEQTADFLASIGLSIEESRAVSQGVPETLASRIFSQLYPDSVDTPGTDAYAQSVKGNWYVLFSGIYMHGIIWMSAGYAT